jgi:hypothetical protein
VVSFQHFLDFSIFVDGNADPLSVALQSSGDAIQTINAQHDTRAALTELNAITPVVSDMCPVNALHNPPVDPTVPIIRSLPSTHYNSLNDSYQFFSASPAHAIRKPSGCARGFPLYFVDTLHNCLRNFLFWKKADLLRLADTHDVRIPSSSSSRITVEQYTYHLMHHVCNSPCERLVFCFVPIGNARTLKSIGSKERSRRELLTNNPLPAPHLDHAYQKPTIHLRNSIIKEWQELFTTANQKWGVCATCSRRVRDVVLPRVAARSIDFSLLRNDELPNNLLPTSYNLAEYDNAILNPKGLSNTQRKEGLVKLCTDCSASLKGNKLPKYALANWLYYAHDRLPSDVRQAFKNSTPIERALILLHAPEPAA